MAKPVSKVMTVDGFCSMGLAEQLAWLLDNGFSKSYKSTKKHVRYEVVLNTDTILVCAGSVDFTGMFEFTIAEAGNIGFVLPSNIDLVALIRVLRGTNTDEKKPKREAVVKGEKAIANGVISPKEYLELMGAGEPVEMT